MNYAQKKASLWESGQLIPTPREMQAMSELLYLSLKELEESFSGVLPYSTADLIRNLAKTSGEGLIASCFTGRVKSKMLEEDEDALREAVNAKVSVAIFFPFPLESIAAVKQEYSAGLTNNHQVAWRTVVKFWKALRSFCENPESAKVKLYRPKLEGGANVLFPPIFHRSTLLCERTNGRTKAELYSWTQGEESDGFYRISGRSLENSEDQAAAWELFFGDVFDQWSETGKLAEGDLYWQAYNGQSETEGDQ
ncbi:MAG: hypothetical protein ACYCPS_05295 [Candidatus Saccharimonadales bacterium]